MDDYDQSTGYDEYTQQPPQESAHTTNNARNRSGKPSKEAKRKQIARWRSKNVGRYREYMKHYMRFYRDSSPLSV